ncbi:hypothetical protein CRUP_036916, partial [Coryphaenoides rupestris]
VYSFGVSPWKQSQAAAVSSSSEPSLEGALSGQRVVWVAAGSYHCGAVTEDGGVHMWGENRAGQCGLAGLAAVPNPTPVALLLAAGPAPNQTVPALELACGATHTLALSAQREVWAWGSGCQLGLRTTSTTNSTSAPLVWKPQRVEHLAGRHVLQVECGASHSLALVRCQGPQDAAQRPPPVVDKCGQCHQLLYTMTDKEDHVIISDGHYCPLGVELTEEEGAGDEGKLGTPTPTPAASARHTLRTSPSEPILPSHSSAEKQQGAEVRAVAAPASVDPGQPDRDQDRSPGGGGGGEGGERGAPGAKANSSPYPDEQALKAYLRKLSDHSEMEQVATQQQQPPGRETYSLVNSCASAVGERVVSTYEALSLKKMMHFYLTSTSSTSAGGAPRCLEGEEGGEESMQGRKSSSTGDIRGEEAESVRRRLSLPGLLSQGRYTASLLASLSTIIHVSLFSPRLLRKLGRPRVQPVALTPLGGCVPGSQEVLPSLQTEPLCVKSLNNKEVMRVAAGARHSLALTAGSQPILYYSGQQVREEEEEEEVEEKEKEKEEEVVLQKTQK